jgi:hypothetical protein
MATSADVVAACSGDVRDPSAVIRFSVNIFGKTIMISPTLSVDSGVGGGNLRIIDDVPPGPNYLNAIYNPDLDILEYSRGHCSIANEMAVLQSVRSMVREWLLKQQAGGQSPGSQP